MSDDDTFEAKSYYEASRRVEGTTHQGNEMRVVTHVGYNRWAIRYIPFDTEPEWNDESRWDRFLEVWGFK